MAVGASAAETAVRSLIEIGRDHYTDKGFNHRYWELYDLLLARHRLTARTVLEIGVYQGQSMEVWREAFPNAELHGVDVKPVASAGRLHVGNAYTDFMLADLPDSFDVIVDDGPHTLDSMQFVAERYAERLTEGGTLVIEDVQQRWWIPLIAGRLPKRLRDHSFVVDRTTVPGVPSDSVLFVVENWI